MASSLSLNCTPKYCTEGSLLYPEPQGSASAPVQDPGIASNRSLALPAHDEGLTTPVSVGDTCTRSAELLYRQQILPGPGRSARGRGQASPHPSHSGDLCCVRTPAQQSGPASVCCVQTRASSASWGSILDVLGGHPHTAGRARGQPHWLLFGMKTQSGMVTLHHGREQVMNVPGNPA